jgi:hypothetical protein
MTRSFASGPSTYLDELIRCGVGDRLLSHGLFPNAKEVTESFAAYSAVLRHLPDIALSDRRVTLVAVGDGHSPRTGALFALRSAWRCISVDPALKETGRRPVGRPVSRGWGRIDRLEVIAARVEDVTVEADVAVIVAVHSHAPLDAAVRSVRANRIAVVAMPCCVPQVLSTEPDVAYQDPGIWSPERTVLVWRNLGGLP